MGKESKTNSEKKNNMAKFMGKILIGESAIYNKQILKHLSK